jgi:hypothetical protein
MNNLHTQTLIRELNKWRKRLERKLFAEGLDRLEVADLAFLNDRLEVERER